VIDLPPFDALALSLHHSPGVHAILVGSGLSRAAGIPTGWEITIDLIRRLAALDGVTEHDNWAKWYCDKFGKEPSYSEILDALASTPAERRSILHRYIEPDDADDARRPTKAHHAIAQLVASGIVRVLITTNFDRLIENALREVGIEPTVIASDDAIVGATPLVHTKCTVIKVHGDYLDARIKNTDSELAGYSTAMNSLLDQIFDNFGLLAVGWSGQWDMALRAAILRAPSRRYPFFWAARGSVGPHAQDLINQRDGRSFPITDADTFFVKLAETLESLKQASRPHPQSVEMAIALAKRYCRDDKFALEWADFLHAEVKKVREYVAGPEYPTYQPTNETLNVIIATFTIKTEVLRRACLICGRWGTAEANKTVTQAIQSLSFADESQSGYVCYASMRVFGASTCFYWNLAGLIERGEWSLVERLMHTKLNSRRNFLPFISILPPQTYREVDWTFLQGLEKQYTPISDYLFEMFIKNACDIFLNDSQADALFDKVELLISFEFSAIRLQQIAIDQRLWFWCPKGRFFWKDHGDYWVSIVNNLFFQPDSIQIYLTGLLGGTEQVARIILDQAKSLWKNSDRHQKY